MGSELRRLPSVDKVISDERIKRLRELYPHDLIVGIVRQRLEADRLAITSGSTSPSLDEIVDSVCSQVAALEQLSLRPVVNASGVIIHTNLGRAPLSKEAAMAMGLVAMGFCNLEFDLDSGARGSRDVYIEQLLCQLTGAEAALVVNNNAAAVLLVLTALAKKKEVIVSRGQAVEIGGGFRIPDVMRQSGAKLIEGGTTNCTYISDYGRAAEPTVQQSVSLGVELACFSGDKLVGGPQAGIIVGSKALVDKLRRHALARAVRIDKKRVACGGP